MTMVTVTSSWVRADSFQPRRPDCPLRFLCTKQRYLSEKRSKVWLHSCEGGRCESSISAMSASVLNSVWYSACSAKAFSSSEPKLDSRQRPYSGAEQRQPGTEPLTEREAAPALCSPTDGGDARDAWLPPQSAELRCLSSSAAVGAVLTRLVLGGRRTAGRSGGSDCSPLTSVPLAGTAGDAVSGPVGDAVSEAPGESGRPDHQRSAGGGGSDVASSRRSSRATSAKKTERRMCGAEGDGCTPPI
mmetsp:Transcript_17321/g.56256  ORF Transcript_17321/g.56256 Transcript_17321/m.56256 type:complete len:245 (-) Transcript_17321:1542-2276(-)